MKRLYFLLIPLCVCAAVLALRTGTRTWVSRFAMPKNLNAAFTSGRTPTGPATAVTPCKVTPGESEFDQAWCAFDEVIGQRALTDPQSQPAFLYWAAKSDIGLDSGLGGDTPPSPCPGPDYSEHQGPADSVSVSEKLENTISAPVQLSSALTKATRGGRFPVAIVPTEGPVAAAVSEKSATLAAVRFNSTACDYLSSLDSVGTSTEGSQPWFQDLVKVANERKLALPDLPMPKAGAIFIKTIWQVQVKQGGPLPYPPLSWTCQTAQTEGTQDLSKPADDLKCLNFASSADGSQLKFVPSWHDSQNQILRDASGKIDDHKDPANDQCAGDLTLGQRSYIPGICLYHVPIQYSDKQAKAAIARVAPELNASGCIQSSCDLVLVGVHVIMFVDTPTPHSLWATFWWTPTSNRRKLPDGSAVKGPWAHFQMKATSVGLIQRAPKPGQISADPNTIVFNPYLEGPLDANGAVSNCIQCHQFASFDLDQSGAIGPGSTTRARTAFNSNDGIGLPSQPPGACPQNPDISQANDLTCGYLKQPGTIRTQQIWSFNTRLNQVLTRNKQPTPAE